LLSWRDGVVPVALEGILLNVEGGHFGIGDLDTFRVAALLDVASDGEAGIGGSGADQLDDDVVADERLAAPVLGNRRALVEADIGRYKQVIGAALRSRTEGRQTTEVAIAVASLNCMIELGRPEYAPLNLNGRGPVNLVD
jgi:hypothetical protein